jgi:hypothetical protein
MCFDYQTIANQKAAELNVDIYVVEKDGSFLYLTFNDDFSWNDVLYVSKS